MISLTKNMKKSAKLLLISNGAVNQNKKFNLDKKTVGCFIRFTLLANNFAPNSKGVMCKGNYAVNQAPNYSSNGFFLK